MSNPFFSIITTSFNYGRFIGATIESVLKQSFPDWELIVVDDCSSDDSWSVIGCYQDARIRAVRFDKNRGACAAYNAGLALARGCFIASLDSDDLFAPDKLARQHAFLMENQEVDICGTWLAEIDQEGKPVGAADLAYEGWFNRHVDLNDPASWVWQNRLCHSSSVIRKEVHDRLGVFSEDLVYTPDWHFWLRALVAGVRFGVVEEPLTLYRNHGLNITHRRPLGTIDEYARTSAFLFHPYLFRCGRLDLIEANLFGFLRSPPFRDATEAAQREVVAKILGLDDRDRMPDADVLNVIPPLLLAVAENGMGLERRLSVERDEQSAALKAKDELLRALQADVVRIAEERRASEEAWRQLAGAAEEKRLCAEERVRKGDERLELMQGCLNRLEEQRSGWVERASLVEQALTLERRDRAAARQAHEVAVSRLEQALQAERENCIAVQKAHETSRSQLEHDFLTQQQALQLRVRQLDDERAVLALERDDGLRMLEDRGQRVGVLTALLEQAERQNAALQCQVQDLAGPATRYLRLRRLLPAPVRGVLLKVWRIAKRLKEK